jgi:hypothetical protein
MAPPCDIAHHRGGPLWLERAGTVFSVTELADAFAWWEDKQVAVRVNGKVVRGWVRSARHTVARDVTGRSITGRNTSALAVRSVVTDSFAGQMAIVLMLDSAAEAALFPSEIHVGIQDDGHHGRPVGVARLWPEYGEEGTVRARPAAAHPATAHPATGHPATGHPATGHNAVQRRLTQAAHRRTPLPDRSATR